MPRKKKAEQTVTLAMHLDTPPVPTQGGRALLDALRSLSLIHI